MQEQMSLIFSPKIGIFKWIKLNVTDQKKKLSLEFCLNTSSLINVGLQYLSAW